MCKFTLLLENSNLTMDISKIAQVALPTPENILDVDADISEDELEEGHIEEDSDFLADFPDNTEVRT